MKKIVFFVFFFLVGSYCAYSQINLVNTETFYGRAGFTVLEKFGEKYFTVNNQREGADNLFCLKIYNMDHTLFKEIRFDLPEYSDFTIDYVSTRLFNLDDKIEFAVLGDCQGFAVLDEEGNLLLNSEYSNACRSRITNTSSGALLLLPIFSMNNEKIEVYELPGKICYDSSVGTNSSNLKVDHLQTKAYPNPAKSTLKIEYGVLDSDYGYVNIYNLSGVVVKAVKINKYESSINIDVAEFPKGLYMYDVRTPDNKRLSQSGKVLIK